MSKKTNLLLLFSLTIGFFAKAQTTSSTAICVQGLVLNIASNGVAVVAAKTFDGGSSDTKYAAKDLTFKIQSPAAAANASYDATKAESSLTFNCVGFKSITLWVGNPAGEWVHCETLVEISNKQNVASIMKCPYLTIPDCANPDDKKVTLSLPNKCVAPIVGMSTLISDGASANTTTVTTLLQKAIYSEFCVPDGKHISFQFKIDNTNPLNGVSTFDMVLISKHILGNQVFKNPWTFAAADVNNNGIVSTSDVVELRRLILGIIPKFTNNDSWRFFPDSNAVSLFNGYTSYWIKNNTTIKLNFVKVGDINLNGYGSCPKTTTRATKTLAFSIENKQLEVGDTYTLAFDNQAIDGFQGTFQFDENALELIENDEFSILKNGNQIVTSQLKLADFKLVFKVKKPVLLSNALQMNDALLASEAYQNDEAHKLALHFSQTSPAVFELLQNYPNPFSGNTQLQFQSPSEGSYQLLVIDALGRVVKKEEATARKGLNTIDLAIGNSGIYSYQVTCNGQTAVKKMMVR